MFGPVITVQQFSDEDGGAGLGERHQVRARVLGLDVQTTAGRCGWRARLDFGCVWINTHIPLVAEMPHGGFKNSGYGKDLSMYGFEDYTRIKHVMSSPETERHPGARGQSPDLIRGRRRWAAGASAKLHRDGELSGPGLAPRACRPRGRGSWASLRGWPARGDEQVRFDPVCVGLVRAEGGSAGP